MAALSLKIIAMSQTHHAWLIDGNVYLAPTNALMDMSGIPLGARWECSIAHWRAYWDVYAQRGFKDVTDE